MKRYFKTALAVLAVTAAPLAVGSVAQAQVSGIATANPTLAIAKTKAFSSAYSQIGTQYKSYFDQIDARNKTLNGLRAQLDTNNDKQLTQEELDAAVRAKNPVLQSIQTEENEIQKLQTPAVKAQMFAVEAIFAEYGNAQQKVVSDKKISVILDPEAFLYAPSQADVTNDITAALDARLPSVSTTPGADWQPQRNTVALHQQLQQLLVASARNQAAQQQQQPPAAQPASR
ncbi:OmpH family outer membrane protein [Sphingorhabdus sp. SMR4y]|uniref:OmpH family outer membrane protein n=1 Tax=Sphingorhabdus sp. SMR4y TaxID=2584094 RepID=UPI000B5C3CB8|nr:OmpH family outer membrane protein [Sphingorhabdus sp. SMR4y]ASK88055.1 outer membrane protein (OmpH-like) [Sphingorhabdus sp. SMR4y]